VTRAASWMLSFGLLTAVCACKKPSYDQPSELTSLPKTPRGLPEHLDPETNPTTLEKVALGRLLFFDERLSKNDYMACVDCHKPDHGWAATTAGSLNVAGKQTRRKSPGVVNTGYLTLLTWDGRAKSIEEVALIAWKNQLSADPDEVAGKLAGIDGYAKLFQRAFGSKPTPDRIVDALGAFLRALKSGNSPYDRYVAGETTALSPAAVRGKELFSSLGCARCHAGPLFTDQSFHNVGIGSGKTGADQDLGRAEPTKNDSEKGKFRTPPLRDTANSGPWFHDGSAATLNEAIRVMASGGVPNPNLDPALSTKTPSNEEIADLEAFVRSLSGEVTIGPPKELPGRPAKK
jgi:cytochrome c peroxidase